MSQCVPNWDLDDTLHHSSAVPLPPPGSRADYEVAELTWVNGHPSMHGLGHIRGKPNPKFQPPWDKGGGTLESVVDQATGVILVQKTPQLPSQPDYDIVPWIAADPHNGGGCPSNATPSAATTGRGAVMDALVPCSNRSLVIDEATRVPEPAGGRCKRARDGSCSASGSAASMGLPMDTCEGDDLGLTTSTSPLDGSPDTENTSCRMPPAVADEHDSVSHSRNSKKDNGVGDEKKKKGEVVRSSGSTKRSRAAAVHNQSERKRRDRINQRMKTLQKLVPNSSKTDKASMLDEVIDYLKQLQAQVQMMSRMSTMANPMMMPMHMQQLQMAMMAQMAQMAQMGMGLGMAMGVDMNPLARSSQQQPQGMCPPPSAGPMLHPPSSLPLPFTTGSSWDGGDQRSVAHNTAPPIPLADPFSAFMACQPQMPVNVDAFNRMVAAMFPQMYQQQQPPPPPQQSPNPNK